jgi:hypothetical protein
MSDIKLSLTVAVPGGKFMSEEACQSSHNYETSIINLETIKKDKKTKKTFKASEHIVIQTRGTILVNQVINMSREAYNYMTSSESPEWCPKKIWSSLGKAKRLEKHMERTCAALGGVSFTYTVFPD